MPISGRCYNHKNLSPCCVLECAHIWLKVIFRPKEPAIHTSHTRSIALQVRNRDYTQGGPEYGSKEKGQYDAHIRVYHGKRAYYSVHHGSNYYGKHYGDNKHQHSNEVLGRHWYVECIGSRWTCWIWFCKIKFSNGIVLLLFLSKYSRSYGCTVLSAVTVMVRGISSAVIEIRDFKWCSHYKSWISFLSVV